jgi:Rieske 2Fe-2S family protein
LYAGHVSQIPDAGDYFLYEIGDDSLIVIRDPEGAIHALFNTCRHRGSALCSVPTGNAKRLVCPYHQWVYDTAGNLLAARHSEGTVKLADYPLHRAHCRVMEGFIFVSLAEVPADFERLAADLGPFLKPHVLEIAKIAASKNYEVRANWKLIIENSRECYHCRIGHPEYSHIMLAPGMDDPPIEGAGEACPGHIAERFAHYEKLGLRTKKVEGEYYFASRYPLARAGAVTESRDGGAVAPLMGGLTERDAGVLGVIVQPSFMLEAMSDYTMTLRFVPVHAMLTRVRVDWLVHAEAVEGRDYHVEDLTFFWRRTAEQDWKLCEDNQKGVNSSRYTPGPYLPIESGVEEFIQWYLGRLK